MNLPNEIKDKLIWLFILFPGILSLTVICLLCDIENLSETQIIFSSFGLTFINIVISLSVYWVFWYFRTNLRTKFSFVLFSIIILLTSIVSGIVFGISGQNDWLYRVLRAIPITDILVKRSSDRPLLFLLKQNTAGLLDEEGDARPKKLKKTEAWVEVILKNGKKFEGWPEFYEGSKKPSELYLSPACRKIKEKCKEVVKPIEGPGIIIFEREIETITFIDREVGLCSQYWLPQYDSN